MCSLTTECVLLLQNVETQDGAEFPLPYYRMCSLTTECGRLQQNVETQDGAEFPLPVKAANLRTPGSIVSEHILQ